MNEIKHASPLDALSFALFRAHNGLIAVGDRITAPYGLTSARWQVMGAVALSGQPLTVAQIARVMGLTRQAVQRIVNELEKQNMLALSDNPAHKRARLADLTSEGRAAYDAIVRQWRLISQDILTALDSGIAEAATATLEALKDQLDRHIPPV